MIFIGKKACLLDVKSQNSIFLTDLFIHNKSTISYIKNNTKTQSIFDLSLKEKLEAADDIKNKKQIKFQCKKHYYQFINWYIKQLLQKSLLLQPVLIISYLSSIQLYQALDYHDSTEWLIIIQDMQMTSKLEQLVCLKNLQKIKNIKHIYDKFIFTQEPYYNLNNNNIQHNINSSNILSQQQQTYNLTNRSANKEESQIQKLIQNILSLQPTFECYFDKPCIYLMYNNGIDLSQIGQEMIYQYKKLVTDQNIERLLFQSKFNFKQFQQNKLYQTYQQSNILIQLDQDCQSSSCYIQHCIIDELINFLQWKIKQ